MFKFDQKNERFKRPRIVDFLCNTSFQKKLQLHNLSYFFFLCVYSHNLTIAIRFRNLFGSVEKTRRENTRSTVREQRDDCRGCFGGKYDTNLYNNRMVEASTEKSWCGQIQTNLGSVISWLFLLRMGGISSAIILPFLLQIL